ncbi:MAG: ABC transporter ATP-binding protein [Deltaproteobacteria bacterium]|nr:ABC transporter ATP-binding protein [Deltaproteobacteria bacterium]
MLKIKGLGKTFGGLAAVSSLDVDINQGDIMGLIGPNGAGKTTVFNLITGYLKPTLGEILMEGDNITAKSPHYIAARGIARTFQATNIFPEFTVLQNVILASHLRAETGLWKTFLHTPASKYSDEKILEKSRAILQLVGMEQFSNVTAQNLAHGHKRILGIAIALAAEPKLLLLDEPLGGMNAGEVSETVELINKLWQRDTTILLIEHNMRAAMSLCKKILVLNFGRKIAEGSPEVIKEDEKVIQAYLGSGSHVT